MGQVCWKPSTISKRRHASNAVTSAVIGLVAVLGANAAAAQDVYPVAF
jgi:hypothetical protein